MHSPSREVSFIKAEVLTRKICSTLSQKVELVQEMHGEIISLP